jgi:tetratricopeptide (TPR) repeat protein
MSHSITDLSHWRQVLRRQSLANAERWLTEIEQSDNPATLILADYDNLLRALETALQSPDSFDLAYRLVQALYGVAFGYADWQRWLVYLEAALTLSRQLERPSQQARLLEQISDLLYYKGETGKAQAMYQEAGALYEQMGNRAEYASLLAKLALVYDLQGQSAEGISLCYKALILAEAMGDYLRIGHANLNLSHLYIRGDNIPAALKAAENAYHYYTKLNKPELITRAVLNMIACWTRLGEWEKADDAAQRLMDTLSASGDIRALSLLKQSVGAIAYDQANYVTAEAAWQEALRLNTQIQDPTELPGLYNNLGMVYTRMGEWQAAHEMLEKALAAYEAIGNVYNWANSMDNLADLYEAQRQTAAARQALDTAVSRLQNIADTPHTQKLRDNMRRRLNALVAHST